jgi:hypothetical protein
MNKPTEYDAAESWLERRDEAMAEMVHSFMAHGRKRSKWRVSWRPVDADTVARIWLVYGKRGTIFESESLAKISEQVLNLIARLSVSTEISGHSQYDARPMAEEYADKEFTDAQWERFIDGMEDASGQWYLSDYGMEPLEALFVRLFRADSDEEKLMTLDRIFNVVHQRSDLSAMFIQGGVNTLNRISQQGGYVTPFADYSDQIAQQHGYAVA